MSNDKKIVGHLLSEAGKAVIKNRDETHGPTQESFEMIGDLWTVYLNHVRRIRGDRIMPQDVAQMMSLAKKVRSTYGVPNNPDNFIDDIGYSALAGMLVSPDPGEDKATTKSVDTAMDKAIKEIGRHADQKSVQG